MDQHLPRRAPGPAVPPVPLTAQEGGLITIMAVKKSSLIRLLGLITSAPEPEPEPEREAEHEVYLPKRWDLRTCHSAVIHTGTLASCEEYLDKHRSESGRQRHRAAIRPTGQMTGAEAAPAPSRTDNRSNKS